MQFDNQAQEGCYPRVLRWLGEMFGDNLDCSTERPEIGVMVGSAYLQVQVLAFDDDALIVARACVATQVPYEASLHAWLLEQNHHVVFGAFGLDPKGDVVFSHSLLGSAATSAELATCVKSVGLLADHFDDIITQRWGGKRALDRARPSSPTY